MRHRVINGCSWFPSQASWYAAFACCVSACVCACVEALTDQVDNIVLPLISYTSLMLML